MLLYKEIKPDQGVKTWEERIREARERGSFTEEDNRLAGRWNTCLVGEVAGYPDNQFAALDFFHSRPGYTTRLHLSACMFPVIVGLNRFAKAERLLKEIQAIK